ncbi:amino acid permease [uncultured Micrococcus sp.]|uniref:amino acid permease n=1 Tax=uncultured Micrococcus sp. TaxID=114051 RepID=UPI00259586E8|nr:amino acid permease [uncultured Micrococcus sp.]
MSGSRTAASEAARTTGDADGPGLQRELSTRHIIFIALGSAIGTGLFLGSSAAITAAGPGVLLAYLAAGAAVFFVMRALGEMAVREPVSGSFSAYAFRYLGPFAGFLTGWSFVFELAIVIIADITAAALYMQFWYPGTPAWVWIAAVICFIAGINIARVGRYGELEFWLSIVKVVAVLAMIGGGIALMLMGVSYEPGAPTGPQNLVAHGGLFPTGAAGMLAALSIVVFSFGGIETIGITAGEAKDPSGAIPKAINSVPVRILLFYVGTLAVTMSLVPWDRIELDSSPFVQIFGQLGVPFAAHLLNFVVLTAAVSAVNGCTYSMGRLLYSLAQDGQAPRVFTRVSSRGVPWASLLVVVGVMVVGAVVNTVAEDAFVTVAQIATFSVVWTWTMILLSHLGMRRAMTAAGERPGAFAMPGGTAATWATLAFVAFVVGVLAWLPESRQALAIGLVWVALLTLVWVVGARRHSLRHARTGRLPQP